MSSFPRDTREDQGFTLVELMVVILILAILMAIAIPIFLGASTSAKQRAAQSDLHDALTAEQSYYSSTAEQRYTADVTALEGVEHGVDWTSAAPSSAPSAPNQVAVVVSADGNQVLLAAEGRDGSCYQVERSSDPAGPGGGSYTGYEVTSGACSLPASGSFAGATPQPGSAAPGAGWYTSW